jgi:hypothetical protein
MRYHVPVPNLPLATITPEDCNIYVPWSSHNMLMACSVYFPLLAVNVPAFDDVLPVASLWNV